MLMKRSNCPEIQMKIVIQYFLPVVYRQGDIGTSWYAVLSGSLDVKVSETANHQVREKPQSARSQLR